MKIKEIFSYRNLRHDWIELLVDSLEGVPNDIFLKRMAHLSNGKSLSWMESYLSC